MAALSFQIEFVLADRGFVIARLLEAADFRLTAQSTLAGCAVTAMDMPRAKNSDGSPRLDLFAFRLRDPADSARFKVGEVVDLSAWHP